MSFERLKEMISLRFKDLRTQHGDADPTVELMVHPGYPTAPDSGGCGQGPDLFAQSNDRKHELDILVSEKFLSYCSSYNKVYKVA